MATKYAKIRLNLDKEKDRRVYEYLDSCGGSLCRAAVSALYDYVERLEEDAFLERIIQTIREETQKANVLSGLIGQLQQVSAVPPQTDADAQENEDTISDFLDAFN